MRRPRSSSSSCAHKTNKTKRTAWHAPPHRHTDQSRLTTGRVPYAGHHKATGSSSAHSHRHKVSLAGHAVKRTGRPTSALQSILRCHTYGECITACTCICPSTAADTAHACETHLESAQHHTRAQPDVSHLQAPPNVCGPQQPYSPRGTYSPVVVDAQQDGRVCVSKSLKCSTQPQHHCAESACRIQRHTYRYPC